MSDLSLEKLLPLLRAHGVKSYRRSSGPSALAQAGLHPSMDIEFFPAVPAIEKQDAKALEQVLKQMEVSENCHCGHSIHSHSGEGYCLVPGCPGSCDAKTPPAGDSEKAPVTTG